MNPHVASLLYKLIITAEVVDIGKDAESRSSILLISQRDDTCLTLLLDPSLGRRFSLKLSDDTRRGLHQCLAHAASRYQSVIRLHLLFRQGNHLPRLDEALALFYLDSLMSDNLF